ncbi:MAG: heparinase, partial [Anaerolineae bacterium]|nr:heparinase [Anaerolineae bacterium]
MLHQYNPIDIEHALCTASPQPPFPPAADRDAWEEVKKELGEEQTAAIIAQAEADAKAQIPSLPATLYLEFVRTGQREGYQIPRSRRRQMLSSLALAECLEYQGRFLDPLLNVAWAICEESSWALPAHQRALTDMEHPIIDLGAAMTALELAELDLLLGKELDPALGKRIRYEVDRRCLTPYLTRHDHWWLHST